MKIKTLIALAALSAAPAAALAQDQSPIWADLAGTRPVASFQVQDPPAPRDRSRPRDREARVEDEWSSPRTQFLLSVLARVDFPGGGDVTRTGEQYGDIFDIGYGFTAEASMISWLEPHWGIGGFISLSWDRFEGASHFPLLSGETFSFDNWDQVSVIVGGKVVQRVSPFIFWEGRMGVGFVHYGELTFTDETTVPFTPGLQFFRPVTHGVFDIGGRASFGSPRLTFDLGVDFRFMGPAARGRDVTNEVDPDAFFVFSLELGMTLRF